MVVTVTTVELTDTRRDELNVGTATTIRRARWLSLADRQSNRRRYRHSVSVCECACVITYSVTSYTAINGVSGGNSTARQRHRDRCVTY